MEIYITLVATSVDMRRLIREYLNFFTNTFYLFSQIHNRLIFNILESHLLKRCICKKVMKNSRTNLVIQSHLSMNRIQIDQN